MQKLFSIAALFIAVCFVAPAANAATIVTATWTGTIRAGNDAGNHFGGTLNAGDAFRLKSVFDTSKGTFSPANGGTISGGGMATMTINGHDFTFALDPSTYKLGASGDVEMFLGDTAQTFLSAGFFAAGLPNSILTAFDKDCKGAGFCSGTFEIAGLHFSGAAFDATHLTVAIARTPLPASLPLFAATMLGLGLVCRRKAATPI